MPIYHGDPRYYVNTGGLKKIGNVGHPCLSSEHNPPNLICLDPGLYEYVCPSCQAKTVFTVPETTC